MWQFCLTVVSIVWVGYFSLLVYSSSKTTLVSISYDETHSNGEKGENIFVRSRSGDVEEEVRMEQIWTKNFHKGKRLWGQLQDAWQQLAPNQIPSWDGWKVEMDSVGGMNDLEQCEEQHSIMEELEQRSNQHLRPPFRKICADNGYFTVKHTSRLGLENYPGEQAFRYINYYSAFSRTVIAAANYGMRSPGYDDVPIHQWLRANRRFADAVVDGWTRVCNAQNLSYQALKFIVRPIVANDDTLATLMFASTDQDIEDEPNEQEVKFREYTPRSRNFYAVLGSPHGFGVVQLLTKYAQKFSSEDRGNTVVITIDKVIVRAFQEYNFDLAFVLQRRYKPTGVALPSPVSHITSLTRNSVSSNNHAMTLSTQGPLEAVPMIARLELTQST